MCKTLERGAKFTNTSIVDKTKPLLSVLMAVYNKERYLAEAIESVLSQTYPNLELILIDNCSSDRSPEIIRNYAKKYSNVYKTTCATAQGAPFALNKGLSLASGVYVTRPDADDLLAPDKFEKQVAFMELNPDVILLGTRQIYISPEGRDPRLCPVPCTDFEIRRSIAFINLFCGASGMVRRAWIESSGGFNGPPGVEDFALTLRALKAGRIAALSSYDYFVRLNEGSYSVRHSDWQKRDYERLRQEARSSLGLSEESSIIEEKIAAWRSSGFLRQGTKVILFGIGSLAQIVWPICEHNGVELMFGVDNRYELQGSKFYGRSVYNPAVLKNCVNEMPILITTQWHFFIEICEQLRLYGWSPEFYF